MEEIKNLDCHNVKIIVVDDNQAFREALKSLLQNEYQFQVIGEASSAHEFFTLSNIMSADIILMDLLIPEIDGYSIAQHLLDNYHHGMSIIAMTMHTEKAYLQELVQAGFKGCVFKPDIHANIKDAILKVLNKKYYFPSEIKI